MEAEAAAQLTAGKRHCNNARISFTHHTQTMEQISSRGGNLRGGDGDLGIQFQIGMEQPGECPRAFRSHSRRVSTLFIDCSVIC